MNKIIFLFCCSVITLFGQSESQIGWIAKFGAAGGFSPMIMFPDYDEINPNLTQLGMEKLNGPIVAWGGGGYAYVMIVDNLRLGGYGFVGSQSSNNSTSILDSEVIYSIGGGAATIEYTMPFVKNIALSAGLMIGGGSIDIEIYQNKGESDWNEIWQDLSFTSSLALVDKERSLKNSFFFLSPTLNVDLPVTRFLAIRGGLGYQFTFGSDWTIANGKKLNNVPSGINGNSLFIQTGIYIGLFAF